MDAYTKQVRSVLEYSTPVWHPGLTVQQSQQIERVQNVCLQIIQGDNYKTNSEGRTKLGLQKLEDRRKDICLKFGLKSLGHPNHQKWFVQNTQETNLRNQSKLKPTVHRTARYQNSPIPYLTQIINQIPKK